ncbi:hypothetical protein D5S17_32785 [Pseudonocardiaceae bacterium YIM PH 21723]|nr:hypothetical protein D5S17_32785 [Pseudonocardiaceae bacterium YIM PH 21723]
MANPGSTVKTVRMALFTMLAGAIPATNALVCLDGPTTDQPDDIVSIGDVHRQVQAGVQLVGGGGTGWADERYVIVVTIEVFRGGDRAQMVFERAVDLADLVEAAVRADPTFAGLVIQANPQQTDFASTWAEDHSGRLCTAEVQIAVHARQ